MKKRFTDELARTLSDFVRETSDEELRQAFEEADYAFYHKLDCPVSGLFDEAFRENVEVASFSLPFAGIQLATSSLDHPFHPIAFFTTSDFCEEEPKRRREMAA